MRRCLTILTLALLSSCTPAFATTSTMILTGYTEDGWKFDQYSDYTIAPATTSQTAFSPTSPPNPPVC